MGWKLQGGGDRDERRGKGFLNKVLGENKKE